jgi:hypothetical protein
VLLFALERPGEAEAAVRGTHKDGVVVVFGLPGLVKGQELDCVFLVRIEVPHAQGTDGHPRRDAAFQDAWRDIVMIDESVHVFSLPYFRMTAPVRAVR